MKFEEVKLKEICIDMHQGINTVADKVEYKTEGMPIIQSKNITSGYLDLEDVRYLDDISYLKYKDKYNPEIGDILLCNIGTIGSSIVIKEKNSFLIAWNLFKLKINKEQYNPNYIKFYLDRLKSIDYFDRLLTGGTVKFINKTKMSEIIIPICSLKEQFKVVDILDKAQELIDKRKEQIEALDELVKSKFIEIFGEYFGENYLMELDSVTKKITDGEHGTVQRVEKGIPYLMARNISMNNSLLLNEVSYIEEKIYEKINSRCNPEYEDLLIVCVGATIGKVSLVPKMEKFSIARSVALVKYDRTKINGTYLLWLFNHEYMKHQMKNSSNESAQAGLYIGKIKKLKIPVPPLELQSEFKCFVEQVDKLKFEMENSLKELEDNFNALMQKAFKGELFNNELGPKVHRTNPGEMQEIKVK